MNFLKTKSGKRIPPICGWCDKNHPTHACKKSRVKWVNHRCTNCKGLGHPKTVCTSPNLKNENIEIERHKLFLLTTPEGIHKINVPTFDIKNNN